MDNHVVVTTTGACARQGLATLRFNFRGVGASEGAWGEGRGERADVRAAVAYLRQALPQPSHVAVAGYSFGAAMAAAVAASGEPLAGLALVAPPVTDPSWEPPSLLSLDGPLLVVAGSEDAYCPREALVALATAVPAATITEIDGADHFFFVGLPALDAAIAAWAAKLTR